MTTEPHPASVGPRQAPSPLTECLIALAGTPDDSSWITTELIGIGQLAADLGPFVSGATVTAGHGGARVTVATRGRVPRTADRVADGGPGVAESLTIPLFAGRGTPIAALSLYGSPAGGMGRLAAAVRRVYEADAPATDAAGRRFPCGDGAALLAGLSGAFAVRGVIQQAIGVVMADTGRTPDLAYLTLRLRAAETGMPLPDTAAAMIAERLW